MWSFNTNGKGLGRRFELFIAKRREKHKHKLIYVLCLPTTPSLSVPKISIISLAPFCWLLVITLVQHNLCVDINRGSPCFPKKTIWDAHVALQHLEFPICGTKDLDLGNHFTKSIDYSLF
jgi:hypothetical protein